MCHEVEIRAYKFWQIAAPPNNGPYSVKKMNYIFFEKAHGSLDTPVHTDANRMLFFFNSFVTVLRVFSTLTSLRPRTLLNSYPLRLESCILVLRLRLFDRFTSKHVSYHFRGLIESVSETVVFL